jgi:hypothetical protein
MPRILPTDWRAAPAKGAAAREIETLALLEAGLPAGYTVIHGVHWSRTRGPMTVVGEIDFVIVAPDARVLLIEQKSGLLEETPEGLIKRYAMGQVKHVGLQLDRTVAGLRTRLGTAIRDHAVELELLLYCPDHHVRDRNRAGLAAERIVDHPQRDQLARRILQILPAGEPSPVLVRRLVDFFAGILDLVPDTGALIGQAENLVTRVAGGLAHWARRLHLEPFRLNVRAAAGSGKTLLAQAIMADATRAGRRVRYVCYNRPLADHVAGGAPPGTQVASFHQGCEARLKAHGASIDFSGAGAFEELVRRAAQLPARPQDQVDELIVDEGQDFEADWAQMLFSTVAPGGRIWWLEDPLQRLYERSPPNLDGWARIEDRQNYRSPRRLQDYLNLLLAPDDQVVPAGPFEGEAPVFLGYADTPALFERTRRALTLALAAGFRRQDIVLISYSGRERSRLHGMDAVGNVPLRSFQGGYDMLGMPSYSEGEVLLETVFRFKGRAAPCVILTEVDFEELDARALRRLYVGMSRATLQLYVVASTRALTLLPQGEDTRLRGGADTALIHGP